MNDGSTVRTSSGEVLLRAENICKEFSTGKGQVVHAVSGIDLEIHKGETLALVGESGCGKSTLARTLIRLIPATSGKVYFQDRNILDMPEKEFKPIRKKMQMVFQYP